MATDFFDQQDAARRRTGLLIGYFLLAVLAIIVAIYSLVSALWVYQTRPQQGPPVAHFLDAGRAAVIAPLVLFVIATGTLYKTASLRRGGPALADLLGGRLVNPGTTELAERRLLNVVEEMALASGTPVPSVYLLPKEPGINAFAAGFGPGDAVIGVSRGSLDHLSRDELQGVIAHEFSHILNGDMRLNLRLIGLLHGILLLALLGQLLIRTVGNGSNSSSRSSSRSDKDSGALPIFLLGVGLVAIGFLGLFFGRLIKAAVSRQREYLADSSAVQFTRNPDGIAGALKKIGGLKAGSKIVSPNAEQACHMYFGAGVYPWFDLLATHPPLDARIRRLDPSFNGSFPKISAVEHVLASEEIEDDFDPRALVSGFEAPAPSFSGPPPVGDSLDSTAAVDSIGAPREEHFAYATALLARFPAPLAAAAREPFSARAVIYALLLDPTSEVRGEQLDELDREAEPGTVIEVLKLVSHVDALGAEMRLPLADLTLPALRQLSPAQYRSFRRRIEPLVMADREISLFEFALQRMLLRHLDLHFSKPPARAIRFTDAAPLRDDIAILLSALASLGHDDPDAASKAFDAGLAALRPTRGALTRQSSEACSLRVIDRSLGRIGAATPALKHRVLDACAACIAHDGRVTVAEGELLRAISDALDCPMPPLLADAR